MVEEKETFIEGFLEDLAETYWINIWIIKIISSIAEREKYIQYVNAFEKACIESEWIYVEKYNEKLKEKMKEFENVKTITAEDILKKDFEICTFKFALLIACLKGRKEREFVEVGV
jgi:hypothetical protein